MEVDVLPLSLAAVPDAGLLGLAGAGPALRVDVLGEADVGDAGGVLPDDVHVGVQDGRVDWLVVLGEHCGVAEVSEAGTGRGTCTDTGKGQEHCKQKDGPAGERWGQAGKVTRMDRQWARGRQGDGMDRVGLDRWHRQVGYSQFSK